jgi:glutamate dehydrogenase/leucine dehydrogenase
MSIQKLWERHFGVISVKPLSIGGSEGREDATARGGWYIIAEAAKDLGIPLRNATVAIQGFGNVVKNRSRFIASDFSSLGISSIAYRRAVLGMLFLFFIM